MTELAEKIDLKLLHETLDGIDRREKIHAGWMASVITSLPHDPAFRKLGSNLREEIISVIAAVE